jgi:hypothetical protein
MMVMVHTVAHITITTVVMMTRLSVAILSPTSYAAVAPKPVAPESARPAVRGRFAAVLAVVVRARPVYPLTAKSVRAVVFLQRRRLDFLCMRVCVCGIAFHQRGKKERKKERVSERAFLYTISQREFPLTVLSRIFDIFRKKKEKKKNVSKKQGGERIRGNQTHRSGGLQHPAPETVRLARKHQSAIVRTHPISNSRARGKLPSRLHTKRVMMMLMVQESRRVVHLMMMIEVLRIRLLEVLVVRHRVEEIGVLLLLLLLRHWELLLRLLLRCLVRSVSVSVSSSWSRCVGRRRRREAQLLHIFFVL